MKKIYTQFVKTAIATTYPNGKTEPFCMFDTCGYCDCGLDECYSCEYSRQAFNKIECVSVSDLDEGCYPEWRRNGYSFPSYEECYS